MPRGKPTGWSAKLYDYIAKNEGKEAAEITAALKYPLPVVLAQNLLWQLANRGAIVQRGKRYYMPQPVTPPRTAPEWKPLQAFKAGWQRPTYDALPGFVIRGEPEGVVLA